MAKTNETDKDKILSQVLLDIEKQFGKGAIMKLGDDTHNEIAVSPSGSLTLDLALGVGGYPKGRILVLSSGLDPSSTLINPIDCSYALALNILLSISSFLELNLPCLFLKSIIFSIDFLVKPDIYLNIDALAVFMLTPTLLTDLLTTKSSASFRFFSFTSC